jgi:hypothetical protein
LTKARNWCALMLTKTSLSTVSSFSWIPGDHPRCSGARAAAW